MKGAHRNSEAKVVGDCRLHGEQAVHPPLTIEEGAAAVAGFHRNGNLEERTSIELPQGGEHAPHHAEFEAVWRTHGHHLGTLGD